MIFSFVKLTSFEKVYVKVAHFLKNEGRKLTSFRRF